MRKRKTSIGAIRRLRPEAYVQFLLKVEFAMCGTTEDKRDRMWRLRKKIIAVARVPQLIAYAEQKSVRDYGTYVDTFARLLDEQRDYCAELNIDH